MSRTAVSWTAILLGLLACGCAKSAAPTSGAGGTATIRGRVTTVGGEPISGAEVIAWAPSLGWSFGPMVATADGRFELRDLPAGQYQVVASKREFLRWRYRQATLNDRDIAEVDVTDGQVVDYIDLHLPRGAVVEGRVVDDGDRPVSNIQVTLVERRYSAGRVELSPLSASSVGEGLAATTNDRGEYRLLGIRPGDYFVLALAHEPREPARRNPSGLRVAYADTFYPSATDPSDAAQLSLSFADVRRDISIVRATVPVFEVQGYVIDRAGRRSSKGRVQAMRRRSGDFARGLEAEALIRPDGGFVLTNVRPGRYSVRALLAEPESRAGRVVERRMSHSNSVAGVVVNVPNDDVTDLRLTVSGPVRIHGGVVFDDATAARSITPDAVCTTPTLWDFDDAWLGVGELPAVPGSRDTNVGPGYRFEWMTMGGRIGADAYLCTERIADERTWHVKAIRANGRDVTDSGFLVDPVHPPDLQILMTNRQPRLTGVVTDASGAPRANRVVIVFAQDPPRWVMPRDRYVSVTFADRSGRYRATVPGGDYYVAATEQGSSGSWTDPEFLASLVPHATRLSLREGERASLSIAEAVFPVAPLR